MKSRCNTVWQAILLAGGMLAAPAAFATTSAVQFNFGPVGAPTVTALFQDDGVNQVQLTISAVGLSPSDTVSSLFFNFDPNLDSKSLTFDQTGSVGGVTASVSTANNSYKVTGGSGKFDVCVTFGDSPAFVNGDSVTFNITSIGDLSVDDFLYEETASAGNTPRFAAGSLQNFDNIVIVQGTPNVDDGPNGRGVPDVASTSGLLAMALAGIGFLRSKVQSPKSQV